MEQKSGVAQHVLSSIMVTLAKVGQLKTKIYKLYTKCKTEKFRWRKWQRKIALGEPGRTETMRTKLQGITLHGILHQNELHHLVIIKSFPSMLYPRKESAFFGTCAAIPARHGRGTGSGVCLQAALHPCGLGSTPRCVPQGRCNLLVIFCRDPS